MQRSTETVSCNKAARSHQAATGSGESREGALKWSHIISGRRHFKSEISLRNAARWFQPFVKDSKTILQIFCLHLFFFFSLSDVSHDGLHLSSVNLLPLAVINDNVMKSLSGGKKRKEKKNVWSWFALRTCPVAACYSGLFCCSQWETAIIPLQLSFLSATESVKWWVCREAPIFLYIFLL